MAKAYKSKWIITASDNNELLYEDSALIVENGKIVDIISNSEILEEDYELIEDFGNAVITPGFVNLYTKLEYNDVFKVKSKGFCTNIKQFFISWHKFFSMLGVPVNTYPMYLADIYKEYKCLNKKDRIKSFKNGLIKALTSGTTCIVEATKEKMYFEILNRLPIKTFVFFETFADSGETAKTEYKNLTKLINKLSKNLSDSTYIGLYPYSLLNVNKKLWRYISKFAKRNNLKIITELMESQDEYDWFTKGQSDLEYINLLYGLKILKPEKEYDSCVDYLKSIKILNSNLIIKNGNFLNNKELKILSEEGVKMCISPIVNNKLFNKTVSMTDIMNYFNKNFGLASGNPADNENFNMLKELINSNINLPIEEAIKYITLYPAKILGVDNITGSIDIGKHADFNVFKLSSKQTYKSLNEINSPKNVYIQDECIVENGEFNY